MGSLGIREFREGSIVGLLNLNHEIHDIRSLHIYVYLCVSVAALVNVPCEMKSVHPTNVAWTALCSRAP